MDGIYDKLIEFEKEHGIVRKGSFVGKGSVMDNENTEEDFIAMFESNGVLKELTTQVVAQSQLSH